MPLTCRVVTPDATYFDGVVQSVVVPASTGELAFYNAHAPLIAQLGNGILRAKVDGKTQSIAIFGGFVKVKDDTVLVLAGGAENAEKIDRAEAEKKLAEVKKALEEKRPPKASEAEYKLLEEDLVRAEVRYAAVTGTIPPIRS